MVLPTTEERVVAALAGRRIDADNAATPTFPAERVPSVRNAINALLRRESVTMLVSSAACGADLVALEAATFLGIRCRVVLPFASDEFRRTSVVDRGGDWGRVYDQVLAQVKRTRDLIILDGLSGDHRAYSQANEAIIAEAKSASSGGRCIAILVWDRYRHSDQDATAEFGCLASKAGMQQHEVLTSGQ